ncbi:hypothetical protein RYA05_32460 [Pseudomonas syringae pv. actinidiae]|uniref:Superfamily II DNA or RNA helicase n=3 Tax=Pseudomonas syringae TaxID=317 RepID=A0A2V0R3A1_PSESF|nr:hypothetical protein [Pseudomonas syringae]EPN65821.1 hypothetical protein A235_12323 [Pseudomonas syringae pv. actinidiae ICMP 19079]EPN70588.1 hypothetical protein A234_23645 [Pseudomonas syringae pv. actinidiae ICMP 19101]AKT32019.1 hypothetical protein IYO_021350 [Pseudomonas syringae pv. actinidiae ICMP 18884]AOE58371.1 hypothetical protein NZ708_21330 [Pseudomonas syringae pv. actinidiae ICMP 18708]APP99324.1 hypothetical protein PsaNZ45_21880 [Pseudomonas syringae pv. actinidiae]
MKNKKSKAGRAFMSGLLLAMSYHAMAQVEVAPVAGHQPTTQEQAVQNQGRSTPVMLSDRIHQIASNLENTSAVHQYNFTAVRGQNVLITTPDTDYDQKWRLEYQVDGGEWQPKRHSSAERIEGLNPGSQVNIRIVATDGARFETADYSVVFGSFPHMRYDLHHEEGFRLIPYGFTKPAFLATQALTEAMLEVTFTDSKAFPLEGGVFDFELDIKHHQDNGRYISDSSGKIMHRVAFKRCEGGWLANNFTHLSDNGRETWSTRYEPIKYWAKNILAEQLADKPHIYNLGLICNRWLINWSRN